MYEATRIYLYVFGVLTIAGGVMGFVKAKSTPSLVAGGLAGGLLLVAGYLAGTVGRNGFILGQMVSVALAIRFVSAFIRTRKTMPAG
ncbi:MAG: hypothetical protein K0S65_3562, partial [Labilithrix sp.]|nr:hypothetical protein [Labilithrix sp.]